MLSCCFLVVVSCSDKKPTEEIILEDFGDHQSIFEKSANYILKSNTTEKIDSSTLNGTISEIDELITNLKYDSIYRGKDESTVYFLKDSYFGFDQGLLYTDDGVKPDSIYFTELSEIEENWFIFKSK